MEKFYYDIDGVQGQTQVTLQIVDGDLHITTWMPSSPTDYQPAHLNVEQIDELITALRAAQYKMKERHANART